jgi:hypothetical protein
MIFSQGVLASARTAASSSPHRRHLVGYRAGHQHLVADEAQQVEP